MSSAIPLGNNHIRLPRVKRLSLQDLESGHDKWAARLRIDSREVPFRYVAEEPTSKLPETA